MPGITGPLLYGTMTGADYFSKDYASARSRFIAAACAAGARMDELHLDAMGPNGIPLATEIAWLGSDEPERVFIHSSGIHGVEGFAGSAVQLALLSSEISIPDDTALIVVHCLNPYGMAWLRRVNENNVDLNRNFVVDETDRTGAADHYHQLNDLLNPSGLPGSDLFYLHAVRSILKYGMPALKQTIAEGQYEYPDGLFYGGKQFEQSATLYLGWLGLELKSVRKLFAIDVHTGLGKWGTETLFLRSSGSDHDDADRLRASLGRTLISDPVTAGAYDIRGLLSEVFDMLEPKPEWKFVLQEFGTYPGIRALNVLRQENRWHHHGDGGVNHWTKRNLMKTFAPDSSSWRNFVVERGVSLCHQVIDQVLLE
jgi:hypothetical protein